MNKLLDYFCDLRNLALFVAGMSILALGSALVMQYGFNILPCHMCYLQRKPYWATIALGIAGLLVAKKSPRATFVMILLAVAAFMANIGMSAFHIGVENSWWKPLEGCGGEGATVPEGLTIEELKEWYKNRPIIDCRVPGFVLFGISLTGYNFLFSTFMAGFTLINAIQGYKRVKTASKT
ncbi:MAG: disulfide bond formation protein B [Alphaproteobacteria bacterium]|nr:MAG: disulfide bond formation protein B [Alphaproteobacteria bacterium]